MRECLQDVFDVPALTGLMRDIASRTLRVVEVQTAAPSPFARSMLFGYVAAFMYAADTPLAERRAQMLALDSSLLAQLLGQADLRELIDTAVLVQVEAELQRLAPDRHARDVEGAADLLRMVGDLSEPEALARGATPARLTELVETHRALRVRIAGEQRWVAVEDAGRLRDALGIPVPPGVPTTFTEPVRDPLGDLLSRYARTHGPFDTETAARRFGLGVAVVTAGLEQMLAAGRLVRGELRPGGTGEQWCDEGVLRVLRRRSLAASRREIEPAPVRTFARFLPAWQSVSRGQGSSGSHGGSRGVDAVARTIEQLQGALIPASAWEQLVLPNRVPDYNPAMLDELCVSGEVLWVGAGGLPGNDGWMTFVLADTAPLLLPTAIPDAAITPLHTAVLEALDGQTALFFRALSDRTGSLDDTALTTALWDLVWAGLVTNDTLAPLRASLGTRHGAGPGTRRNSRVRPARYARPGLARPAMPQRAGPPTVAGRWSLLPERDPDLTLRAHAQAEALLERYGIVTRGAVTAERVPGGFAGVYRILSAFEDAGRCRRGYFVESLGAAQFAIPGAVDRLRAVGAGPAVLVLAAADPANPYGAALPWPAPTNGGHKPGRGPGALVVLVDGELVLYVERGGRTLLTWTHDPARVQPAVDALALAVREGWLGPLSVEKADGQAVLTSELLTSELGYALERAGFHPTPRGLRLRA